MGIILYRHVIANVNLRSGNGFELLQQAFHSQLWEILKL